MRKTKKQKKSKDRFTRKQYNSGDGMLTSVWGPSIWHYLHTMSFNYPINPTAEDKKYYTQFIKNLQYTLPCKHCRINLKNNFKSLPLRMCHMKDRGTFSRYIYNLHETINKMLNKKSGLTYCNIRERYENFRSRCVVENPKIFKFKKTRKESGCTEPMYGKKAKCVIKIVPEDNKCNTFQMDKTCIKNKI